MSSATECPLKLALHCRHVSQFFVQRTEIHKARRGHWSAAIMHTHSGKAQAEAFKYENPRHLTGLDTPSGSIKVLAVVPERPAFT